MSEMLILLALFAVLTSIGPLLMVRRSRRSWLAWDAGSWIALVAALGTVQFSVTDPWLVLAIAISVKLAVLAGWLATRGDDDLRHDAWLIAAFALGVYLVAGTATLRLHIDGDEPYYVFIAESILRDADLDLRNQYEGSSIAGRPDLGPQLGDPTGRAGEQYSRHLPFLPLLLIPGISVAGLWGAMATIALLSALAIRGVVKLLEECGVERTVITRVWPLIAFAPPFLFYAIRIWPEAPGALALTESIRAAGKRRWGAMLLWLLALSLLKIRFALIAGVLIVVVLVSVRPKKSIAILAIAAALVPLAVAWIVTGSPLNIHETSELTLGPWWKYVRGLFGLVVDAQAGMLFQAPVWLAGLLGLLLFRRELPDPVKWGAIAAIPYLILLFPRDEWHGGWSPPLRYITVFMPLIAAGAVMLARRASGWLVPAGAVSAALVAFGLARPSRLFHIANGESTLGEWLSASWSSDFSRLLPSLIRPNFAAFVAGAIVVLALVFAEIGRRSGRVRFPAAGWALVAALIVTGGVAAGFRPGSVVHFEDAHVTHLGGELHPHRHQVARFAWTGGWTMRGGDAVRFRLKPGAATLFLESPEGGRIAVNGSELEVAATGDAFAPVPVQVDDEAVRIEVLEGTMILDRIVHE